MLRLVNAIQRPNVSQSKESIAIKKGVKYTHEYNFGEEKLMVVVAIESHHIVCRSFVILL